MHKSTQSIEDRLVIFFCCICQLCVRLRIHEKQWCAYDFPKLNFSLSKVRPLPLGLCERGVHYFGPSKAGALPLGIAGTMQWPFKSLSHITTLLCHITAPLIASFFIFLVALQLNICVYVYNLGNSLTNFCFLACQVYKAYFETD